MKRPQAFLIGLALLAITAAVYWPVFGFEFVNYDDADYVVENARVQAGLTLDNAGWAFRTMYFENWHPLTWLSYMFDAQVFGVHPGAFHLVNVFFHALNTLLVFAVLKRMTGAQWRSALAAGLFALHPLHVESVAWVAERKDVLSGFFWMLTLWTYLRFAERPISGRYALVLLCFALGLMTKPMLVTLPFALMLLDFWPLRRLPAGYGPAAGGPLVSAGIGRYPATSIPRLVAEKVPMLALTLVSSVLTYSAQHAARLAGGHLPLARRLANGLVAYARYLGKTLWPTDLSVFYPYPSQWPAWEAAGAALLLLAITAVAVRQRTLRPYLAVGWFWFLGTLVPVIGLVQVGGASMADRYMYIPMLGLLLALVWGVAELAARRPLTRSLSLGGVAAVFLCAGVAVVQVRTWRNSVTLFEHALAVTSRNAPAHNYLGDALLEVGKTNEALGHFSAAVEADPQDFMGYANLGNVLLSQGRTGEALVHYRKGLELNPNSPELNHNLGLCLASQGNLAEAVNYYVAAVRLKAEFAEALLDLGKTLAAQGKLAEAVPNYLAVLRARPNSAPAHFFLALALTGQGKTGEALAEFAEAVRLNPNAAEFRFQRAATLVAANRPREAVAEYHEALRLKPDHVQSLNNLAWLLATEEDAKIRNGTEAAHLAERACELTGSRQPFLLGTLAAAYAEAGQFPKAVETAQKAIDLAEAAGQKETADANRKLAELYRVGKPFRASR